MSSLTCDICLEEYGEDDKSEKAPKILSCGHTFCSKCIELKMRKDNNQIICSIDRLKDERPFDKIPYNRIIYDMILKEKEQNNSKMTIKEIKDYDIVFNIGMIGCQNTGKTSLSVCYEKNAPVSDKVPYVPTISLDFFHRVIEINDQKIFVRIWDTAGQERFNSITSGYLRGLHGCFIVYDITDRVSFEKLNTWIQLYKDFNQYKKRLMIVLGNKVDIENREVTRDEGIRYCKKKGLKYFETSSRNMQNVNEAFDKMIKKILKSQNVKSFSKITSKIHLEDDDSQSLASKKSKKTCC